MKVEEELYQEIILDHYRAKHHSGLRDPYDAEVHHYNPLCGDEVTLRVRLDGDTVRDVSYEGVGCSISQASTSVMKGDADASLKRLKRLKPSAMICRRVVSPKRMARVTRRSSEA